MNNNLMKYVSIVLAVVAFLGIRYAFDAYQEHQAKEASAKKIEEIKKRAAENHPELPRSVAEQQEAVAMAAEDLANETDKRKQLAKAAGNFFGFYLVNVRERVDYCRRLGVEITPFASEFSKIHEVELERARSILAKDGITEEKLYEVLKSQLSSVVTQDMQDVAAQYDFSQIQTCQLFVDKGELIADKMRMSEVQPAVYKVLMRD